ncbi:MFS transporter [Cellulomonas cellasea]|uniref:MFS family permease n=1 Tax=Cellulomonas cellasea TaxID=43670 RepID=A0A7W4UHA1_9CELL|nr:MFS transporter [Cellulomonas cellasea]MBB2923553.1 MFS family permease [Cellulomonas cellasea]
MTDPETSATDTAAGAPPPSTSPFVPGLRATTLGMLALVALGAFEALAVSTAMPTVVADLGGVELYATAFAGPVAAGVVGLTVAGLWSDRRSPVPPLLTGVALFLAGLVVAGLAGSMPVLVAGRVVQGVGSGLYSVVLYVVVARVYPEATRPRVFAAFAAAWVVPGLIGPFLAGVIVEQAGWRWVFLGVPLLAVPAVLALWPSLTAIRQGPPARPEPVDPEPDGVTAVNGGAPASGTSASSTSASSRPASSRSASATSGDAPATGPSGDRGADARASTRLVALSVVAAVGVLALHHAGRQRGAEALGWTVAGGAAVALTLPRMLPTGTLRAARGLPTVIALRGLLSAAFTAAEVFMPLLLQTHRGLGPSAAGAVLTCAAVSWSTGSWLRGRGFGGWSDVRWLRVGAAGMVAGIAVVALVVAPAVPVAAAYAGWTVAGLGMGLAFPTTSLLTLRLSPPESQGANSSALQIMDSVSIALVLALSGALLTALGGPAALRAFAAGFALAAAVALAAALVSHRVVPRRDR